MDIAKKYPHLFSIECPEDLRALPEEALGPLTEELRDYLVQTMSRTGGHFAANLGTVELATALHYVFDTPHDRIVWDVGHQAYPHKILCERAATITTIKKHQGLAPFPTRGESEYDTFGAGHSSTSISAAASSSSALSTKRKSTSPSSSSTVPSRCRDRQASTLPSGSATRLSAPPSAEA